MVCTNGRCLRPEWLDSLPPELAAAVLRDLVRVNSWLGGHRIFRRVFAELVPAGARFTVLDVGAASGDMGASLRRCFPGAAVTSLDRRPDHLSRAPEPRVTADAFRLPFPDASFDFVACSLFLHHFSEAEIVGLLETFRRLARRAVVVLDLERHPLAYYFLPATRRLFGWQRATVHDGCASVAAGFHPGELACLARRAGASRLRVRRHLPWFRISLVLPA